MSPASYAPDLNRFGGKPLGGALPTQVPAYGSYTTRKPERNRDLTGVLVDA